MRAAILSLSILMALSAPALAIDVDGRIDPAEWQGARHITDFRKVQPLTGTPATHPTEAWVLATPDGLAIGFRNIQPAASRTRQRVQRDFEDQVDRVNLMIDFDGDGRTGYNFTISSTDGVADAVITNESDFNDDWDGNWKHAVSEDADGWSAEMLIPWYIAPMRGGEGDVRRMKIYLDRVVGSTGNAWPGRWRASSGHGSCPSSRLSKCRGTASRCWRSRRTHRACTTTFAVTAISTAAWICSGSPTASSR